MPSRSIRDQMQMRPQPVMGVRPTSPQPVQARPMPAPQARPAIMNPAIQRPSAGGAGSITPQLVAQPAPTGQVVNQAMSQINTQPQQPRPAVAVQQAPVGNAPARAIQPMIRQPNSR